MNSFTGRIAPAPISWGVSEVPGWGFQMGARRVLREMLSLGIRASEMGPDGYFSADDVTRDIKATGFSIIAGFVPITFRFPGGLADSHGDIDRTFARLRESGAVLAVLAIAGDGDGYDARPILRGSQWDRVAEALKNVQEIAAANRLELTIHPHFGTFVQTAEEAVRILDETEIDLCLDTGHLALAGDDPAALVAKAAGRVAHVHLKDVDAGLAEEVRRGNVAYREAVRRGLFRPLGDGTAGIERTITSLETSGYNGWYVLEQDLALLDEPVPGGGPLESVKASLDFLAAIEPTLDKLRTTRTS